GAINDAVLMPLGSTIVYVITAHVSAASGAQIVNQATATVQTVSDPNSNNGVNTATDTDAVTDASADLSVTKSDGVTGVSPDTDTTYTITVANNNGPSEIDAGTVRDLIPPNLQK